MAEYFIRIPFDQSESTNATVQPPTNQSGATRNINLVNINVSQVGSFLISYSGTALIYLFFLPNSFFLSPLPL